MRLIHIPLDKQRMIGKLPWGLELPLKPFFGIMAVAPPAAWGMINSPPPRRNGGNMDNKELVAGTTLYLPIHTDGALFSCGDGHGAQGDGEVCITAIETGLIGTFELIVRPDMTLEWPMAETPTHVMTMAFDPDLDDCVVIALRDMIKLICARTGISREDAYTLCSLAADLRVTQVVNGTKGIHVMLEKKLISDVSARPLVRRPHAQDAAAGAVGREIDRAVGADAHVADALADALQQALLAGDLLAVEREPHEHLVARARRRTGCPARPGTGRRCRTPCRTARSTAPSI